MFWCRGFVEPTVLGGLEELHSPGSWKSTVGSSSWLSQSKLFNGHWHPIVLRPTVAGQIKVPRSKTQLWFQFRCTLSSSESALMLDDIIHPDENCRAPKIKDSKMCLNIKVPSTYARWLISLLGGGGYPSYFTGSILGIFSMPQNSLWAFLPLLIVLICEGWILWGKFHTCICGIHLEIASKFDKNFLPFYF